jgi:hypothetical protein
VGKRIDEEMEMLLTVGLAFLQATRGVVSHLPPAQQASFGPRVTSLEQAFRQFGGVGRGCARAISHDLAELGRDLTLVLEYNRQDGRSSKNSRKPS